MEKREIYILGAKSVDFTNRETGELVKGTSIHYFDHSNPTGTFGHVPSKYFLPHGEDAEVLKNGAGIYNLKLEIQLNGNRPRLTVKGFEFVKKAILQIKDS